MPGKVDTEQEESLPDRRAWALDEEVERLEPLRQCPKAKDMKGPKHTLLGADERQGALSIT